VPDFLVLRLGRGGRDRRDGHFASASAHDLHVPFRLLNVRKPARLAPGGLEFRRRFAVESILQGCRRIQYLASPPRAGFRTFRVENVGCDMAGIAERRAHRARLRRKRATWWGRHLADADERGKVIDTPTPCSCWMCGNPRRYFCECTIGERRWFQQVGDE
jgi:hypothetical protein